MAVVWIVKTPIFSSVTALIAASMLAGPVLADPPVKHRSERKQKEQEVTVFVTGSLIPQRVKVRRIGTNTVSPVRLIDRNEIEQTGRFTTPGAFVNDPSVRIIGH